MVDYLLFGTHGCHLCEEAAAILQEHAVSFQSKDIFDNQDWQEKYGLFIPVLCHTASDKQLNWPFAENSLRDFLAMVRSAS